MELWEIVGVFILAGPLVLTSLSLIAFMIRSGIDEVLRKAPKPAYRIEMDLQKYIRDVKKYLDSLNTE